jgi:hypothetical protein
MVNDKLATNSGQSPKPGKQGQLWETLEHLVMDPMPAVKMAVKEAIDASGMSRAQIADAMNRLAHLAGIKWRASEELLNKWTAPGQMERPLRMELLYLFCCAAGDNRPLEAYARPFPEVRVISAARYEVLLWAEAEINVREAKKAARDRARKAGIE